MSTTRGKRRKTGKRSASSTVTGPQARSRMNAVATVAATRKARQSANPAASRKGPTPAVATPVQAAKTAANSTARNVGGSSASGRPRASAAAPRTGRPTASFAVKPKGKRPANAAESRRPARSATSRVARVAAGTKRRTPRPAVGADARDSELPRGISTAVSWSVSREAVKHLNEFELKELMQELLLAQAYRSCLDPSRVVVNAEGKARDEGCDATTGVPPNGDRWLGGTETCWQFKAGLAGQSAKLRVEIGKAEPRRVLREGGRFAVVASGSVSGTRGEADRLAVLKTEARRLRLPSRRIDVIGCERLAQWLDENPSVGRKLRGLPYSWMTLGSWLDDDRYSSPWHPTSDQARLVNQLRGELDLVAGSVRHVHLVGPPGVGKTRFALEICRAAPWRHAVIYVEDAAIGDVRDLLVALGQSLLAQAIVVVDEAASDRLEAWAAAARRAGGRLRVISIGTSRSPDSSGIPEVTVSPLSTDLIGEVVREWYPEMPREQCEFIAHFSGGFVKLARLAANALRTQPDLDAPALLERGDIGLLLERMLGESSRRRSLHVLAALNSVGWYGNRADEGQAIAAHFGLDWGQVRADVEQIHRRFGIAPRAGDLRYISPKPLGALLAAEAWTADPARMKSLPEALPNDGARQAFLDRVETIVTTPPVRRVAVEELQLFFSAADFEVPARARLWRVLTSADPVEAARLAQLSLEASSIDLRRRIDGDARRHLVRGLARLSGYRTSFEPAMFALAALAVAENEQWGNNATGEFKRRFQISLGGTSVPYIERLPILDDLLHRGDAAYRCLAVRALSQAADSSEIGLVEPAEWGERREQEWRPTDREYHEAREAAVTRLTAAAAEAQEPEVARALLDGAGSARLLLLDENIRDRVAGFLRSVAAHSEGAKEAIWRSVQEVVFAEEERWRRLPSEQLQWLKEFAAEFEGDSLAGRVRRHLTIAPWEIRTDALDGLAQEVAAAPDVLDVLGDWLTSGGAHAGWQFGRALARAERHDEVFQKLAILGLGGPDVRVLAGYLNERAVAAGQDWLDDWLDSLGHTEAAQVRVVAELTWRCSETDRGVERFIQLLRTNQVAPWMSGQLSAGGWCLGPSVGALVRLVQELVSRDAHRAAALALIEHRVSKDALFWQEVVPFARSLVVDPRLVRAEGMAGHYWEQVAMRLVDEEPRSIAAAIFRANAAPDRNGWLLENSEAAAVLARCIDLSPVEVWGEMEPYLANEKGSLFSIGLPEGLLDRMPRPELLEWIEGDLDRRIRIVAPLVAKDLSTPSLFAAILERLGSNRVVSDALFARFVSGQWWGSASSHWEELAAELERAGSEAAAQRVRTWAAQSVDRLRRMAASERRREDEAMVRR